MPTVERSEDGEIMTLDFSDYDFSAHVPQHSVQIMNRAYLIAKRRYGRHGDRDDLRLALLMRYWSDAYINVDDYAASWDATRIDDDLGINLPTWSKASVDLRESVEGDRELSANVRAVMLQATVACVEELKQRWNAE